MRTLLLAVVAALWAFAKLNTFVHRDDLTSRLYAAGRTMPAQVYAGPLPLPADELVELAQGENGFAGEGAYLLAMDWAWLGIAALAALAFVGRRRR